MKSTACKRESKKKKKKEIMNKLNPSHLTGQVWTKGNKFIKHATKKAEIFNKYFVSTLGKKQNVCIHILYW